MWIFDDQYAMLTYLSVCSFIENMDVIVTLIYCGTKMPQEDRLAFEKLDAKVEIYQFEANVLKYEPHMRANILNRLARLHYTRKFEDDILFMIDSDVAFSESMKDDLEELTEKFDDNNVVSPMISGVVEFLSATDAYLYFKKKNEFGYTRKTPEHLQVEAYKTIYGDSWERLLSGFQFNNGFLIFYKARPLIDQWESYYLKGLENEEINPLDDQVPLAVAIQKTGCTYWKMDVKWNSLGDLNGPFHMFHAWGGEWKIEIDQVLRNQKATSSYGGICAKYLPNCPDSWLTLFNESLKSFPYRYRHIHGAFDHGTVFEDIVDLLDEGHIVEVGTYKGRSACFVAELIKATEKDIAFDTIDNYERDDTSPELVLANLKKADVDEFVDVINADSIECSERYDNGQLDFIFLDTDSPGEYLKSELEVWYPKLKAGGILAGYDHTIHDTVFKSLDCVSSDFCSGKKIPLRTYEYQFIIQKPEAI